MGIALPHTVPNAFERVVRWFGSNEAVVDSSTRLTYSQLDTMSRQTAALLASLGVGPGQPLAILAPPSAIFLVAWLGAIRVGALPAVLHTRESPQTLAAICRKLGSRVLVYDGSMSALAQAVTALAPDLHACIEATSVLPKQGNGIAKPAASIPADLAHWDSDTPMHAPKEDDPALIVLSSGTTSVPKGIVHTHRSLIELARSNLYLYQGILPRDRSLVPLSTSFIGCYNGWFPFLNAGACTIFMEHFDLNALARRVSDEEATHVFLTPTLWRRLLNSDLTNVDFSSVRLIGFAAEPMDAATLKRLRDKVTPNVVQMYGSTEAGAAATCITADEMVGDRLVSVGRPMPNGDLRVVQPGAGPRDEVAPNAIGEILISSPSLAAGVWGDEEATRASFVEEEGRRWWRSRDLGRLDEANFLFLEGRRDDMIISGGINIMPARVEEVLLSHPGVAECAVIGVPDLQWGEQVQAFIVPKDPELDAAALEKFMQASDLSSYQRPRTYHFTVELPRTSTNKVIRRQLRAAAIRLADGVAETGPSRVTGAQ